MPPQGVFSFPKMGAALSITMGIKGYLFMQVHEYQWLELWNEKININDSISLKLGIISPSPYHSI